MRTLCMDTAHRYLVIGLYEADHLLSAVSRPSWKRQSETIFPELIRLMDEVGWMSEDIDEIVITDGPGSYTGVRIAMSIAKVFCSTRDVPLYTISTLQLYAGLDHAYVMLDARSERAYFGELKHGKFLLGPCIRTLTEIQAMNIDHRLLIGDTSLIGMDAAVLDFPSHFIALRPVWNQVDNIHTLVPQYLKEQSAYKAG